MAQFETTSNSGEMTQRFIEFVMMQSQNAAMFLGQIPNPQTGEPEINLEIARMFIDQLDMIRVKTKGNLTSDEEKIMQNALSGLQMAYVEAAKGEPAAPAPREAMEFPEAVEDFVQEAAPEPEAPAANEIASPGETVAPTEPDADSKKRFTKSYG